MSHDATWSLNGQQIVMLTAPHCIWPKVMELKPAYRYPPGRPFGLAGSRRQSVALTVLNDEMGSSTVVWPADGSNSYPLLPGWNKPANECCGIDSGRAIFCPSLHVMRRPILAARASRPFPSGESRTGTGCRANELPGLCRARMEKGFTLFEESSAANSSLRHQDEPVGQLSVRNMAEHLDFSRDGAGSLRDLPGWQFVA